MESFMILRTESENENMFRSFDYLFHKTEVLFLSVTVVTLTVFCHSQVSLGRWLKVLCKPIPWSWVPNVLP